jgi:hypothetical protein
MMNEPGLADVLNLQLVRFPPAFVGTAFSQGVPAGAEALPENENLRLQAQQIASFIDDVSGLEIV